MNLDCSRSETTYRNLRSPPYQLYPQQLYTQECAPFDKLVKFRAIDRIDPSAENRRKVIATNLLSGYNPENRRIVCCKRTKITMMLFMLYVSSSQ